MAQFPAVIELSSLNGSNGFQINGEVAHDFNGWSVASAGDINGDGFDDLIVGSPDALAYGGASYIVYGKATAFGAVLELSALNGTNGFQINGEVAGDNSGIYVSSAGDVNGDGFDDLIIGAFNADPNGNFSGSSHVVFGKASSFGANFELSSLNGTNGFQINGEAANDFSGRSVASAGDVNGDGFDDIIVGAFFAPNGGGAGAAYVIFGKASGFAANIELSTLNGTNGFELAGAAGDRAGFRVDSAGDINRDGFDDILVSADFATPHGAYSGSTYVVYGKSSAFAASINLGALNGTNGFKINGEAAFDSAGYSVSSAGDVNGDGFGDIIIGAGGADTAAYEAGASYVVFGKASSFGATLELSSLNGANGFQINGVSADDYAGSTVAAAGDVNGDGFDDLLISAPTADPNGSSSGASYVVFGKASAFGANFNLSTLNGTNGFKVNGEVADDKSGWSVSSAGDINSDGFDDILVGAHLADPHGEASGSSYVVFGRKPDAVVSRTGTIASQTLAGGDFDDTLSGMGGNDTLHGHGGGDRLDGGYGIDTAVFSGARAAYTLTGATSLTGPDGSDTLAGVEKLKFDDQTVILGQGPKIYDFNTDLNADLMWQKDDGQLAVWLIDGTSVISGSTVGSNPGVTWHARSAGDFDGDTHADILWQNDNGMLAIWYMNGLVPIGGGGVALNPGASWQVKASGDFNGDGKADILWQNADGRPAVWLMNGTTLVGGGTLSNPGTSWHVIGVGDFNGDSKSDILWQNDNGQAAVWLMDGSTVTTGSPVGSSPGASWHVKAAGDFNGDGNSDILWQNDNGTPVIWFMDGTTATSGGTAGFNPGSSWQVKGASDFNGDGMADISWQNQNGTPAVWLMNGLTPLAGASFDNPGSQWHVLASGS